MRRRCVKSPIEIGQLAKAAQAVLKGTQSADLRQYIGSRLGSNAVPDRIT